MDEVVSKRIHISGLTPAISAKDLSDRFASFGAVKSIDGFGLLDAVGQPRKFAYVTLETTKGKLARCMNLLSGVTWKGANLRLGEAKPDFRERIAQEHAAAQEPNERAPKRQRRGTHGVHARNMSLVTPETIAGRGGGWRVTATGRLVRPMRMRPARPLAAPVAADTIAAGSKEKSKDKGRKRVREPPVRARRRTLDPVKWGSQHLRGVFLENAAAGTWDVGKSSARQGRAAAPAPPEHSSESETDEGEERDAVMEEAGSSSPSSAARRGSPRPAANLPDLASSSSGVRLSTGVAAGFDVVEEKNQSLGLLQSLFGDRERWGGAESVDSDVEDGVPGDGIKGTSPPPLEEPLGRDDAAMDVDDAPAAQAAEDAPQPAKTKLKDLFAPREEEAGFSLLGHLDLDLEFEDEVPFEVGVGAPVQVPTDSGKQAVAATAPTMPTSDPTRRTVLDPSRPLFFPSDQGGGRGRVSDPTNWKTWFYRTESGEAIRARWEETRGELTAGWKRRHREAVKSRRRRGGGVAEGE